MQSSQQRSGSAVVNADQFRLLVEAVREYAIFLLDLDGRVVSWNAGAERIKGYRADEILGQSFTRFYEPDEVAAGRPAAALTRAAQQGWYRGRGWRVGKDGRRFYAQVTITALLDDQGQLSGYAKVTQDVTAELEADRTRREREDQLAEAEADAELARRLQSGLLPSLSLPDPALLLRTRYRPGQQRALLGADFFDAMQLPDGTVALLIGDVAGHGPDEAAVGVALRAAWRALVLTGHGPGDLLDGLDRLLLWNRPSEEMLATVCCCWITPERDQITVALAGHPAPLLAHAGRVQVAQVPSGAALGIYDHGCPREAGVLEVGEAWTLLCYTDGLVEGHRAPGSVERLGIDALVEIAAPLLAAPGLDGALDQLLAVVHAGNGGDLSDDVAILCLSRGPTPDERRSPAREGGGA
jgi:PAS domain S-box-containing protein